MRGSFLEFYQKYEISPVRQDISDLTAHFERRQSLYRHLGILPALISGKRILEVGPGSGFNSLYTASLHPANYHVVDANATGIEEFKKLFAKFPEFNQGIEIYQMLFENFTSEEDYDVVICEGMLSGLPDPVGILKSLAGFVKPGGILVITCRDAISILNDNLRLLIGQLVIWGCEEMDEKIALLLRSFSSHLETLQGMSRRKDDWVIDNILNPAAIGTIISIPQAIETVADEFEVYGSSPRFLSDWRWYKDLHGVSKSLNSQALVQYWESAHNFLDYRCLYGVRSETENKELYRLCEEFRYYTQKLWDERDKSVLVNIVEILYKIKNHIQLFSQTIAEALEEAIKIVDMKNINADIVANAKALQPFFGRGQQYLSFTKKYLR